MLARTYSSEGIRDAPYGPAKRRRCAVSLNDKDFFDSDVPGKCTVDTRRFALAQSLHEDAFSSLRRHTHEDSKAFVQSLRIYEANLESPAGSTPETSKSLLSSNETTPRFTPSESFSDDDNDDSDLEFILPESASYDDFYQSKEPSKASHVSDIFIDELISELCNESLQDYSLIHQVQSSLCDDSGTR